MNENKRTLNLVNSRVDGNFWPTDELIAMSQTMPLSPSQLRAYLRMLAGGQVMALDIPLIEFIDENNLDINDVLDWIEALDKEFDAGRIVEKVKIITGNIYPHNFPMNTGDALALLWHLEGVRFHRTIDFLDSHDLDTDRIIRWFEEHGQETDEGLERGLRSFLLFADEDGDDICYDCLGARNAPSQD